MFQTFKHRDGKYYLYYKDRQIMSSDDIEDIIRYLKEKSAVYEDIGERQKKFLADMAIERINNKIEMGTL